MLVTVMMLNEGYDCPGVDMVVLARATDSEIVFTQQVPSPPSSFLVPLCDIIFLLLHNVIFFCSLIRLINNLSTKKKPKFVQMGRGLRRDASDPDKEVTVSIFLTCIHDHTCIHILEMHS